VLAVRHHHLGGAADAGVGQIRAGLDRPLGVPGLRAAGVGSLPETETQRVLIGRTSLTDVEREDAELKDMLRACIDFLRTEMDWEYFCASF
jgi:hypothetical protein